MEQTRLEEHEARAYILQPGDGTRYYAVVTAVMGYTQVAIMNESFSDVITLNSDGRHTTTRGKGKYGTNPWTIKAAEELVREWHNRNS